MSQLACFAVRENRGKLYVEVSTMAMTICCRDSLRVPNHGVARTLRRIVTPPRKKETCFEQQFEQHSNFRTVFWSHCTAPNVLSYCKHIAYLKYEP